MYETKKFLGKTFQAGYLFQIDIEDNFPEILLKGQDDSINVLVVGAWHGDEIQSFLRFKNVHIWAFEPNLENFSYLKKRYSRNPNVSCFNIACGETNSTMPLYEGTITGNDSLLEIRETEQIQLKEIHTVEVRRIDSIEELSNITIDMLWADVQGYELHVIKGSEKILKNIQSMFLEVNEDDRHYKGTKTLSELESYLLQNNFYIAHKEIDESNKTGNAFFLNQKYTTSFFNEKKSYEKRILHSLKRRKILNLSGTFFHRQITSLVPISIRATIKKWLHL